MNGLFQSLRSFVAAITLAAELLMPRSVARRLLVGIVVLAAGILAAPREARAFHGHHGFHHAGWHAGRNRGAHEP